MGLDMYLYAIKKEEDHFNEDNFFEISYWRKVNQIRDWFVRNLKFGREENCGYYKVTKEQLIKLQEDCKTVLNNHDLAQEIMPTSMGFFFGSTEYDEYCFDKLDLTIGYINDILEKVDFDIFDVYYSEWY